MAIKKPIVISGGQLQEVSASDKLDAATFNLDTDGTLAANSDTVVASQKAVKTYVDANAGGAVNNPLMTQIFS